MFRDIFSGSQVILAGLVFFLFVVGGSLLYSWHVHRMTDAELAQSDALLQQYENKNETRTAADTADTSTVDLEHAETNLETDDAELMSDETETLSMNDVEIVSDHESDMFLEETAETETEETPYGVSPYGFGAYPEVPADFPGTPMWEHDLDALGFSEEQKKEQSFLIGFSSNCGWNTA